MALVLGHSQLKYVDRVIDNDRIVTLCYPGCRIGELLNKPEACDIIQYMNVVAVMVGANDIPTNDVDSVLIDLGQLCDTIRSINGRCQCSNCRAMETEEECVCCKQTPHINSKMVCEDDNISCIIAHPGFEPVCLNQYVLETAYYQYRQQYGEHEVHDDNERKRYTAYRQLVRWCWGYLGRDVRVVLPSCAVLAIRKAFPSDNYEGFHRV